MTELFTQFEEVKLTYQSKVKAKDRPKVTKPQDAYDILLKSWDKGQIEIIEECKALFLDRANRVMSIASISKGGFSETLVDIRHVFAIALKRRAHGIILAHNHPSGSTKPSQADIKLTKLFMNAGELMRIPIEDHLIITPDEYYSLNGDCL